jgi:uncharacterized membrane protein
MTVETDADARPGAERLVAFSDGVVAIAITLLVLPLTDIEGRGSSAWSVIVDHHAAILGFVLSFAVIANYWASHHFLLRSLHSHTSVLVRINSVWLGAIAFLPFPTSLIDDDIGNGFATLYIGTLFVASTTTLVLARYLEQHPELRRAGTTGDLHGSVVSSWSAMGVLAGAAGLSLASPRLGLLALLLLLPAQRVRWRGAWRRGGEPHPGGSCRRTGGFRSDRGGDGL